MDAKDRSVDPRSDTRSLENLDFSYEPFPPFSAWSDLSIDEVRWQAIIDSVNRLKSLSPDILDESRKVIERAAAVDTGAIEGLYRTDRNFTITIAESAAIQGAPPEGDSKTFRAHFQAQLNALEHVLDFATGSRPIAESWIRELHQVICAGQETYWVTTPVGRQKHPLPKGEYKSQPNHVITESGDIHAWAPVDQVPVEMSRFVQELGTEEFGSANTLIQAAFAHYAFVRIHPFADGNGRVARALASVYTYRGLSVPLLIFDDQSGDYFRVLEDADAGDPMPLLAFLVDRVEETFRIQTAASKAAQAPPDLKIREGLDRLYPGVASKDSDSIQQAGRNLINALSEAVRAVVIQESQPGVITYSFWREMGPIPDSPVRLWGEAQSVILQAETAEPTSAKAEEPAMMLLPSEDSDRMLTIRSEDLEDLLIPIDSLLPEPSKATRTEVRIWVEGLRRVVAQKAISAASEAD